MRSEGIVASFASRAPLSTTTTTVPTWIFALARLFVSFYFSCMGLPTPSLRACWMRLEFRGVRFFLVYLLSQ